MNDEEGFGCHVELAVLQALLLADGERAPILTGVRRGAQTELHPRLLRRHTLRAAICEPRERKVSRSLGTRHPRQGTSPLRRCPGPAWDRPRSPTSRRGQRHLRAPRRDGTGHGAAQQQEEAPHGSGARAAGRWSREGMNGWTHARTDARRRRRRFYRVAPWAGPARRAIGHASRDVTLGMNGRPRPRVWGGVLGGPQQ